MNRTCVLAFFRYLLLPACLSGRHPIRVCDPTPAQNAEPRGAQQEPNHLLFGYLHLLDRPLAARVHWGICQHVRSHSAKRQLVFPFSLHFGGKRLAYPILGCKSDHLHVHLQAIQQAAEKDRREVWILFQQEEFRRSGREKAQGKMKKFEQK